MPVALTVAQLFTPAPSGVGPFGNVPQLPPSGTWLGIMLNSATTVQLPTTSWQSGAPERTILAIEAVCFAKSDVNISIMAQAGFLQSAASGTVTTTDPVSGQNITIPVTPDPSNPAQNPTGAPGWLDLLINNLYNVYRLQATAATGPLAIANLKGSSVGPYSAGAYHASNIQTGATYHNQSSLTIPSSIIAGSGGIVAGVAPGLASTIITTAAAHGLNVGQSVYVLIPSSSGISGLNGIFALVTGVSANTFSIAVSSSGTWTSGGNVYLCTVATMVADAVGTLSNASPGAVSVAITQNTGVFIGNVIGWSGSNWESNTSAANRAVLSLANKSPNGPSQSYVYYAETAQQILAAATPPYNLTNGPVAATEFATPNTGIVNIVVASQNPVSLTLGANVTPGVAQLPISAVSNANPCVLTTSGPTTLTAGQSMTVTVSGVLGTAGVNGTFLATYVSANQVSIPIDTTTAGAYTGGGSLEGGDLGQIDRLIQQNVTPDGTTAVTSSALALPVGIVAVVIVPQAYVAAYQIAAQAELQAQIQSYNIGGNSPNFAIAYNDIVGALEEAGVIAVGQVSYVRLVQSLTLTVGGVTCPVGGQVAFPSSFYQAVLTPPQVTVIGV